MPVQGPPRSPAAWSPRKVLRWAVPFLLATEGVASAVLSYASVQPAWVVLASCATLVLAILLALFFPTIFEEPRPVPWPISEGTPVANVPAQHRLRRSLSRAWSNRALAVGFLILGAYLVLGVAAPLFYPGTNPDQLASDPSVLYGCKLPSSPTLSFSPLSGGAYPLGETSHMGFNVLQGLLLGTRWDLLILGSLLLASVLLGSFVGALAATLGGTLDGVLAAVLDGFLSFPAFLLTAGVLLLFPIPRVVPFPVPVDRLYAFYGVLAATLWAPFAQAVRSQARTVLRQQYVEAARASGAGTLRVVSQHVLPNCSSPILAQVPSTVSGILLLMGAYQYIGLTLVTPCGSSINPLPPSGLYLLLPNATFPEWTYVLANGALGWAPPGTGLDQWWGYLIPTAWIVVFLLGVFLVCDGLVAYLSPYRHS